MSDNVTPVSCVPTYCLKCGNGWDHDEYEYNGADAFTMYLSCCVCNYDATVHFTGIVCEWDNFDRGDLDETEPYKPAVPEIDLDETMTDTARQGYEEVTGSLVKAMSDAIERIEAEIKTGITAAVDCYSNDIEEVEL